MSTQSQPKRKPFVVKSDTRREWIIGIGVGIALLALLIWGVLAMSKDASNDSLLTGTITAKHFEPKPPEEQITVGSGGLDRRDVDGIYTVEVRTRDGKTYTVYLEKALYEGRKVGDDLTFLRPPQHGP
jgi:hypothetical protein